MRKFEIKKSKETLPYLLLTKIKFYIVNPPLTNSLAEDGTAIITDGRLLYNYYDYDYMLAFSVANTCVLALVIKREIAQNFSYYILRVYNLLTHAKSIVYRDYLIEDVNL